MFTRIALLSVLPVTVLCIIAWEDCGKADRSLIFHKLNFATEKLIIDGKVPVQAEVSFDLLDKIDYNVQMDATLTRRISFLGISRSIKLPCYSDAGSCSGQFCRFVESYATLSRTLAAQLHVPFTCLMEPMTYAGNVSYAVPPTAFEYIPSIIANAVSGKYDLVVRWTLDEREIGCLSVSADLEIDI